MTKKETLPKEVLNYREPIDYEKLIGDINLNKLHEIFNFMLQRKEDKIDPIRSKYGNIEKEEIDTEAKALFIEAFINAHKKFSFVDLLEKQNSKLELIVTFLVVLELIKTGKIVISQEELCGDIIITSNAA